MYSTIQYMPKKDQNTPTLQLQYLPLYKNTVLYLVSISLRCSKLIVRSLCHKHRGEQNTAEADSAMFMTSRSQILKDHIKYILTVSKIVHYFQYFHIFKSPIHPFRCSKIRKICLIFTLSKVGFKKWII